MPLDPDIAELLALLALADPPMHQMTPQQAREAYAALVVGSRRPEDVDPVASVQDTGVLGADGQLPARVYRPEASGPLPTVLLFHGGGWVVGNLETHDDTARAIAHHARACVVSVAYRLAPESPFPAAVEDALAATAWAAKHLDILGGNDALAVAGDSAGGNLAAVVAQEMRTTIAAQLLVYPATDPGVGSGADSAPDSVADPGGGYPSRVENGTGYYLDTPTMQWFHRHYAGHVRHEDTRLSPILASSFAGVAPAVVVTAELDPLRDEGEAYARAMAAGGVRVELRRFDSLVHGFFEMVSISPAARAAVEESCKMFAEVLHP